MTAGGNSICAGQGHLHSVGAKRASKEPAAKPTKPNAEAPWAPQRHWVGCDGVVNALVPKGNADLCAYLAFTCNCCSLVPPTREMRGKICVVAFVYKCSTSPACSHRMSCGAAKPWGVPASNWRISCMMSSVSKGLVWVM